MLHRQVLAAARCRSIISLTSHAQGPLDYRNSATRSAPLSVRDFLSASRQCKNQYRSKGVGWAGRPIRLCAVLAPEPPQVRTRHNASDHPPTVSA